jgi:type IV pilus assembly protein PilE
MVVVAVVAILAAVAYPSYINNVRKARRSDAKSALLDLAAREERWFSVNNVYSTSGTNLGYSGPFPQNVGPGGTAYYQISVDTASATGFSVTAAPQNDQINDGCGSFTLDQQGRQLNTGNVTATSSCW